MVWQAYPGTPNWEQGTGRYHLYLHLVAHPSAEWDSPVGPCIPLCPGRCPCPQCGESQPSRCLWCQAPCSGGAAPRPASVAAWLLSPADKLYNTSALRGSQPFIRRRGLWGPDISCLRAASGCLCWGGRQGWGFGHCPAERVLGTGFWAAVWTRGQKQRPACTPCPYPLPVPPPTSTCTPTCTPCLHPRLCLPPFLTPPACPPACCPVRGAQAASRCFRGSGGPCYVPAQRSRDAAAVAGANKGRVRLGGWVAAGTRTHPPQ